MESFLQLAASRQSDRSYDVSRTVEPEKLDRILEAARLSPSACNAQPWKRISAGKNRGRAERKNELA